MADSLKPSRSGSLRLAAARARTFLRNLGLPLPVPARLVYHDEYVTGQREAGARHAFDVRRPQRIVEQLLRAGVLGTGEVLAPEVAGPEELALVHPPEYLREISDPARLAELLFTGPDLLGEEDLLRAILRQTGGTVLAARHAVVERTTVFNLGGGFHHAQRDRAEGFCAINDIAVAVRRLQQLGLARKVLVVDLDFHHGNGTSLIFSDDESVFTLSIHGQTWSRIERKQNHLDLELPSGTGDEAYLGAVRFALQEATARFDPDAAIYVAGADAHGQDTLGDWEITDEGMLERDLLVWRTFQKVRRTPLCVVLGGGYSPFAWTIAYNFIFSVLTGEPIDRAYRPGNIEARYRRIKDRLTPGELKTGAPPLGAQDLELGRRRPAESSLFMRYYTLDGLRLALERYGFLDLLRERGFDDLQFFMSTSDPDRQMVRIYYDRCDPEHLILELVTRFRTLLTPPQAAEEGLDESYLVLSIEWLLMQDPRASFSLDRQRLPGQVYPGLGLGRWMLELLRMMADRLDCQGLSTIPQHYHNAYLYSKQMLMFDPDRQGYLEALKRDLEGIPLVEASIAIDEGKLRDAETGARLAWEGTVQVMPIRPGLNAYFARPSYVRAVAAARQRYRFRLEGR